MSHYILIDDGTDDVSGATEWNTYNLFQQYRVPKVCIVFGGSKGTFENLFRSLEDSTPCILMQGTGGITDNLAKLIYHVSESPCDDATIKDLLKSTSIPTGKREDFTRCLSEEMRDRLYLWTAEINNIKEIQNMMLSAFSRQNEVEQLCQMPSKLFLESVQSGQHEIASMLLQMNILDLREIPVTDIKDSIYGKDKKTLQSIAKFCESEKQEVNGLDSFANDLEKFVHSKDMDYLKHQLKDHELFDYILFLLFVWTIFKGHYNVAEVLIKKMLHPLANMLIASNILECMNESTRDETTKKALQTQALAFEESATKLLNTCHDLNPFKTKFLLVQNQTKRMGVSCLEMAASNSRTHSFLVAAPCQKHLTGIWLRNMVSQNKSLPLISLKLHTVVCMLISFISFPIFFGIFLACIFGEPLFLAMVVAGVVVLMIFYAILYYFEGAYKFFYQLDEKCKDNDLVLEVKDKKALFRIGFNVDYLQNMQKQFSQTFKVIDEIHRSPFVKFMQHTVSFMIYLIFFGSHLVFCNNIDTFGTGEIVLYIYWFAFFIEEIKQLVHNDRDSTKLSFLEKIKSYFTNYWNRLDFCIFIIKAFTMLCRLTGWLNGQFVYFIYSIIFIVVSIRILQIFTVSPILGPNLIMIMHMMKDLRNICVIIAVFMMTYGIAIAGINNGIRRSNSANGTKDMSFSEITHALIKCPFYHLFGELFLEKESSCWPKDKSTTLNAFLVDVILPTLQGLYLLFSVLLLLNLLIALFNKSIIKVEVAADRLWYLHRRSIIFENFNCCILPIVPFSIFGSGCLLLRSCFASLRRWGTNEHSSFKCRMLRVIPRVEEDTTGATSTASHWFDHVTKWEKLVHNKMVREEEEQWLGKSVDRSVDRYYLNVKLTETMLGIDKKLQDMRSDILKSLNRKIGKNEKQDVAGTTVGSCLESRL